MHYENSNPERMGRHARQTIDTSERISKFKEQFSASYSFPEGYFNESGQHKKSQFDRDCNRILDGFGKQFPTECEKKSYISTFSDSKWRELSVAERKLHSLSKCSRCYERHQQIQLSFPLKPAYQ